MKGYIHKQLPESWRWVRIKDVAFINPRRPANLNRADDSPTSFVPMEAVDAVSGIIANRITRPFGEIKSGYTYFAEGDVLFAKITPCMQNGKHAIARNLIDGFGFGTTEFHVIRPGTDVTPEWIHYFLRQPTLLLEAAEHFTGAVGQQRLPADYLAELEIPLPPLPEQKRIIGLLLEQMASVEKARKAAEAQLDAAKALPNAYLRQGFAYAKGWRPVKLGDVVTVVNGTTPESVTPEYWNGDIVWITPVDLGKLANPVIQDSDRRISKTGFESCNLTIVPPGSVVLSSRAPIGHLGIAAVPLCTNQGCKSFVLGPEVDPYFLYYALKRSVWHLQQLGSGATFTEVSKAQLERFEIPLPPLDEQKRIAEILNEQMAATKQTQSAILKELETINALPSAILRQAFNGEL